MQKPLPNGNLPSANAAQQQNISINISYNLNTTKLHKSMLGPKKASSKTKKMMKEPIHGIGNDFFNAFGSLNQGKRVKKENVLKRSNQPKPQKLIQSKPQKLTQPQKQQKPQPNNAKKTMQKKKKLTKEVLLTEPEEQLTQFYNPLANNSKHFLKRNIQSPDIFGKGQFLERKKMKTEVSCYEAINQVSSFKKSKKSAGNSREMLGKDKKVSVKENGRKEVNSKGVRSKKGSSVGTSVGIKQKRMLTQQPETRQKRVLTQQNQPSSYQIPPTSTHNRSCMLYSTKKAITPIIQANLIQTASHLISHQTPSHSTVTPHNKKRAQSAFSFNRKGKEIVSKLLNMSIISSQELGSSQLITSDRLRSGRFGGGNNVRRGNGVRVDELDGWGLQNSMKKERSQMVKNSQGQYRGIVSDNGKKEQEESSIQPGKALRQYLNSIDLRIIKNIQQDTAHLLQSKTATDNLASTLPSTNPPIGTNASIGINVSTKKPQPLSNPNPTHPLSQPDIISFYSRLFTNALQSKHLHQIQKQKYLESSSDNEMLLQDDEVILPKVKKETFVVDVREFLNSSDEDAGSGQGKDWEKEFRVMTGGDGGEQQDGSQDNEEGSEEENNCQEEEIYRFVPNRNPTPPTNSNNIMKLNFKHYKQLLTKPIPSEENMTQKTNNMNMTQQNKSITPTPTVTQTQPPWQNIHEMLSRKISSREKGQEEVIEELIKQCSLSEKWVEEKEGEEKEEKEGNTVDIVAINKSSAINNVNSTTNHNRQSSSSDNQLVQPNDILLSQHNPNPNSNPLQPCHSSHQLPPSNNHATNHTTSNNLTNILYTGSSNHNNLNSPTSKSQDGHLSGQEQYDSKKYSTSQDHVLESPLNHLISEHVVEQQKQKHKDDQEQQSYEQEQDEVLCEQKEEHVILNDNRWVHTNPWINTHTTNQHHPQSLQPKQSIADNYLQCELTQFTINTDHSNTNTNAYTSNIFKLNQVIDQIQTNQDTHFHMTINGHSTKEKITLKLNPIEDLNLTQSPQSASKPQSAPQHPNPTPDPFSQIRKKRLTHIVEDIILQLIKQFAKDISHILKRSSTQKQENSLQETLSPYRQGSEDMSAFSQNQDPFELVQKKKHQQHQVKKSNFMGKCFGIDTSFASVQTYLKQFKLHLLSNQTLKKQILKNINKDIGPNSLQILSYLRPQYQPQPMESTHLPEPTSDEQDQDGLFVVPSQAFSQFQNILEQQLEERNKSVEPERQVVLTMKQKRNMNFWHRGIYQSWNEFLDCERPYGINGKPYEWVTEGKHFRSIRLEDIENKLQKSIDRLLQSVSLPSGIIYDKYDIPQMYLQLNEQQKMILNEERLSRMLAIQLFQSEETWINYNDEMAELLVELSRMVEERIFLELTAEVKKTFRRRKLVEGDVGSYGARRDEVQQQQNLVQSEWIEGRQEQMQTMKQENEEDGYLRQ